MNQRRCPKSDAPVEKLDTRETNLRERSLERDHSTLGLGAG